MASLNGQIGARAALLFSAEVGGGPNAEAVAAVKRIALECGAQIDVALTAARQALANTQAELTQAAQHFQVRHNEQELAFRALIEQRETAQAQATERSRLERQRNHLLAQQAVQAELGTQLAALREQRQALLQQLATLRDRRFAIRRRVAETITTQLAGRIRVGVRQSGDVQQYADLLAAALRSAHVRTNTVVPKLVQAFWPDRLGGGCAGGRSAAAGRRGRAEF